MRHGDLHRREMEKRDFEQGVPHDDREGGAGESRHCDSERPPAAVLDCWTQRCRTTHLNTFKHLRSIKVTSKTCSQRIMWNFNLYN